MGKNSQTGLSERKGRTDANLRLFGHYEELFRHDAAKRDKGRSRVEEDLLSLSTGLTGNRRTSCWRVLCFG